MLEVKDKKIEGIVQCSKYAFMPNRLNYCGPGERNEELLYFSTQEKNEDGLIDILEKFKPLHPYLKLIAQSNNLRGPFDEKVVEAYWLGNELLEQVSVNNFYVHLHESSELARKLTPKDQNYLFDKLPDGAKPHHTFHVLNVFIKTKHPALKNVIETIDNCRISWGKIVKVNPDFLTVLSYPLICKEKKLKLGEPVEKKISYEAEGKSYLNKPIVGDYISFHWNFACEILSPFQVKNLSHYTQEAIKLANRTI